MFFGSEMLGMRSANSPLYMAMQKTEAQQENLMLFEEMFNRFSNIAVTRTDWEGLPDSINERFLNQTLYLFGRCAVFEDENMGILALPCSMSGEFNIYYDPTEVRAYSFNYERTLKLPDFVYVRANPTAVPLAYSVFEYTRRMCDVLRTIDVLCKKMKQPFIFVCEEKEKQTYLNLLKKVQDNEVIVIGTKEFNLKGDTSLKILPMNVHQDLVKLWEVFHNYESLLYTALGINSSPENKRERLLTDEVNANNMQVALSSYVEQKQLEAACELINKKYSLNVSVKMKGVEEYLEGVGEDGSVYDNPSGSNQG